MTALSTSTAIRAEQIFRARAWAWSIFVLEGECSLQFAVDYLQSFSTATGLTVDRSQQIMSEEFGAIQQ
jgi:hypothetical protein